jgi:transcription elongation GreA/GreB family factor
VTFAKLILEIRRRAAGMPQDAPRASAIEQAAREVLKDPGGSAERVLAALVGIDEGQPFDVSILDALTPEAIALLDSLAGEVVDFGRRDELARAVAAALIKRVQ